MKGAKLIKSASFGRLIRDREPKNNLGDPAGYFHLRDNFDNFLDESLQLGQFVPCDKDGKPIDLLPICADGSECCDDCDNGCLVDVEYWGNYREWKKASSSVIFNFDKKVFWEDDYDQLKCLISEHETVEGLLSALEWSGITLTPTKALALGITIK